jgi:hypothetical protein
MTIWGAMDTFFGKDDLPVRQELLSSKRSVQNLIAMIVVGEAQLVASRAESAQRESWRGILPVTSM